MHLFLPLASSILYVVAALFLRQAAGHGIGIYRTAFICNWGTAVLFLLLWPLGGSVPSGLLFYQPAVVALLFIAGQLSTFLALEKGDVSVATPVMGSKVILVALFTTLIGADAVPLRLWAAAALSCLGIVFLNRKGQTPHPHVLRTIWFAFQAAAAYALFDVLVMKWSPAWGVGRFLPVTMLFGGVFSIAFVPLFRAPLRAIPKAGRKPLLGGACFIALQAIILVSTVAVFGDATAVNVVYCTRGLWSVLAVWWLGHWFGNDERALGAGAMQSRLAGAALLSVAVVLVFL